MSELLVKGLIPPPRARRLTLFCTRIRVARTRADAYEPRPRRMYHVSTERCQDVERRRGTLRSRNVRALRYASTVRIPSASLRGAHKNVAYVQKSVLRVRASGRHGRVGKV